MWWAGTYNCRKSRECDVAVASRAGTYRVGITKHDGVGPDEVQHGEVPVLQHRQARYGLRHFGMSYSNEQREYCQATTWAIRHLNGVEANSPHDFLPDQAYFICATIRTRHPVEG